ncbi:MAG: hypothetical protein V4590_03940 [Bacteroidota bacterium]
MKKYLSLLLIFQCAIFGKANAFEIKHAILPYQIKSHIDSTITNKVFVNKKDRKDIIIYYVDFNDCINCILPIKTINNESLLDLKRIFLLAAHIPKSKLKFIKTQFGLPDSVNVIDDIVLSDYFSKITQRDALKKSLILKYYGSQVSEWIPLTSANNTPLFSSFISNTVKTGKPINLTNDTAFYTSIEKAVCFNGQILLKTLPEHTLLRYDASGKFLNKINLNEKEIAQYALPYILNNFPDSVKTRPNNQIDSVLKSYKIDIKPRGMEMIKFNNYSVSNDTLYVAAVISLPIERAFDIIRVSSLYFIMTFNKNLEFIDIKNCNFSYTEYYKPLDFYGFRHNNDGTLQFALVGDKQEVLPKNYFVGKWKNNGNVQYVYKGIESKCFIPDSIFKPYYEISKDLCHKIDFVNDSIIAFEYMPYLFNTNTGTIIKLLEDSISKKFYRLVHFKPLRHKNNDCFLLIENIDGISFASLFDLDLQQRVFMKRIAHFDAKVFSCQNTLYKIDLEGPTGTVFYELDFSSIIK